MSGELDKSEASETKSGLSEERTGASGDETAHPPAAGTSNYQGVVQARMTMSFEGPLPPPQILQAYNQIVPNGAERIFHVFEKQVDHRQELEKNVVMMNTRLQLLGFWSALGLALVVICGGFWLTFLGKSLQGMIAILGPLAALVMVFLVGRSKQDVELESKKPKSAVAK